MTPEELKKYVEHRLSEHGCSVHIGKSGFDRIFRLTEGAEDGAKALCHRLALLGAGQKNGKVDDKVLDLAISDLARGDDTPARNAASADVAPGADRASIDELAAVLEAKVADGEIESAVAVAPKRSGNGAQPKAAPARLPKVLIVDAETKARGVHAQALAKSFTVVEASDGEQAWKVLLEQPDIDLIVTDLTMPKADGYELIKRIRTATSPPHLSSTPIIVATRPEDQSAKLRALMAGANDFILKNATADELRARVLARHRLAKSAAFVAAAIPSAAHTFSRPSPRPAVDIKRKFASARNARASARPVAPRPVDTLIPTLTAERRIPPEGVASARAFGSSHDSFLRQLYRISSTTTITLSATALLALAIIAIAYTGRTPSTLVLPPSKNAESTANTDSSRRAEIPPPSTEAPPTRVPAPPDLPSAPVTRPPAPETSTPNANAPTPPASAPIAKEAEPTDKSKSEANVAKTMPLETPPKVETPVDEKLPRTDPNAAPIKPPDNVAPQPKPSVESTRPIEPVAPVPAPVRPASPPIDANAGRDQTALAERPAPATPSAPVSRISKDELAAFLRRFAAIYEAGDLDQFVNLFADNARTNDRTGRKGIREDYEALFRATDLREMKLGEISWELEGNQAYGWGDFDVTVRRLSDQGTNVYTGSMTFVLEKNDGRLRIVRLYHGQRRANDDG
jgi:DNA-binding response OmpR family regulator/ketosteroid isomerase-like protein